MVLAVLEARCGVALAGRDVYLNVAGGLRIGEPAADLAVAGALLSAAADAPAPNEAVLFGEIGLAGEVRGVSHTALRLKEAAKLGFASAVLPAMAQAQPVQDAGLMLREVEHLRELLPMFGWEGLREPGNRELT
jgi:DNA repair protein RadA/Sms